MLRYLFLLCFMTSCMTAAKRQRMSVSQQYELKLKNIKRGMYTQAL